MAASRYERWPATPVAGWQGTRDTLHLYTQVVGKVRLANEPRANHWWNTTLFVSARGLTTSLMPHPTGPAFQIDFDFLDHRLDITTVTGDRRSLDLVPRTVADFYAAVMSMLDDLGVGTEIWPMPVEIPDAIPFPDDTVHASYDGDAVRRFWLALVDIDRVLEQFRARFVGKASPVHYFWGAIDIAYTRFSGRTAPPHPGGAPNCGPHVMWEAYSHEVSSCGYWPGPPGEEGVFYAYAYGTPGLPRCRHRPGRRAVGRRARRVRPSVRARPHRARPRCLPARVPPAHVRSRRGGRELGPRCPRAAGRIDRRLTAVRLDRRPIRAAVRSSTVSFMPASVTSSRERGSESPHRYPLLF